MNEPNGSKTAWHIELRVEPYDKVWAMQHALVAARRADRVRDTLLLLEHTPVITLGRRAKPAHILASAARLAALGVETRQVERGGDVTYHGPGQIVGYPILRLHDHMRGASDYMHLLEQVLIDSLADFHIHAYRRPKLVGVWTEQGKVAALGARIQRGVTFHGFALNVDPIMSHFQLILPCGLSEPVVSMRQILGQTPPMADVRACIRAHFAALFGLTLVTTTWDQLEGQLHLSSVN